MDTDLILRRFMMERQILANLELKMALDSSRNALVIFTELSAKDPTNDDLRRAKALHASKKHLNKQQKQRFLQR